MLQVLLEELRHGRKDGETFADAWPKAVTVALQGITGALRDDWNKALNGTRPAWEAAWHGQPAPPIELAAADLRLAIAA